MKAPLIISNTSDNPFAIDVAHNCGQLVDISDLLALKDYQNTEFCPRFISDEEDFSRVGNSLKGRKVVIVSTVSNFDTRNSLAMRNLIIARAAKDNGAEEVILIEPDLFYSCQDRGPRAEHCYFGKPRNEVDRKKFDGQPFTALLYSEMLKVAGVDRVFTVHNHSHSTQSLFIEKLEDRFHNIIPSDIYAHYMVHSEMIDPNNTVLCAPDKGAVPFVEMIQRDMPVARPPILKMDKVRNGEREITMEPSSSSEIGIEDIKGKDVVVFDDMVRTGTTIVQCCRLLQEYKPRRVIFCVTHFHSSSESREKLADSSIDEILTTNTIPTILNRDAQGRLRKKVIVMKLEKWLAQNLMRYISETPKEDSLDGSYSVDISSKNPRWQVHMSRTYGSHINN